MRRTPVHRYSAALRPLYANTTVAIISATVVRSTGYGLNFMLTPAKAASFALSMNRATRYRPPGAQGALERRLSTLRPAEIISKLQPIADPYAASPRSPT